MKAIIFLFLLFPVLAFGTQVTIVTTSNDAIIQYSIAELKSFLNEKNGFTFTNQKEKADWIITLSHDSSLKEGGFRVTTTNNGKQHITLSGATNHEILYSVYTFLEKLGYTFEITGFHVDNKVNTDAIKAYNETIIPVAKLRGIRQHINFPMDISSYTLKDAKQYIQNLARMRFNFITFHSYPGQWYEVKKKDTIEYAGNFFYGDRHDMPDNPLIQKNVHNKKVFCIPEIEPFIDNIPKRSKMSIIWLNAVMAEAKRVGMRVGFSFEPRSKSIDIEETISTIQQIQKQYPLIDNIELITEESGGWGPSNTAEETKSILVSFFGNDILKDSIVTAPIRPKQSDLGYIYGQIGHNIKVIQTIRNRNIQTPPLKLGIYCTNEYNIASYYLSRKIAPNTEVSILPAHGSANVAKNTPNIILKESDWNQTTVYSWLEFDGMMYLQQNGINGIYTLIKNRTSQIPDSRFNTIAFNHWRTAENKITARYAALASIFGAIEPGQFYEDYAKRIGIASPSTFSNAMLLLQKAFDYKTSNMGFAWMGYWKNGIHFESPTSLNGALERYISARNELSKCAIGNKNEYAKNTVQFLDNRLRATIIYHQAFIKQNELNVPNLTPQKYKEVSDEVLSIYNACLKVYAEMMPDRGCEGTLINMYLSPIRAVKISRLKNAGIPLNEPIAASKHFDAPAAPIYKGGN